MCNDSNETQCCFKGNMWMEYNAFVSSLITSIIRGQSIDHTNRFDKDREKENSEF